MSRSDGGMGLRSAVMAGEAALERGPNHGLVCLEPAALVALLGAARLELAGLWRSEVGNEQGSEPPGNPPAPPQAPETHALADGESAPSENVAPAGAGAVELGTWRLGLPWRVAEGVALQPVSGPAGLGLEGWVRLPEGATVPGWVRMDNGAVALALRHLAYLGTAGWPAGVEVPMVDAAVFVVESPPWHFGLEQDRDQPVPFVRGFTARSPLQAAALREAMRPTPSRLDDITPEPPRPDDPLEPGAFPDPQRRSWRPGMPPPDRIPPIDLPPYRAQAIADAQNDAPHVVTLAAALLHTEGRIDVPPDDDECVTRAVRMFEQIRRELESR